MELEVITIKGPPTDKVSKVAATQKLTKLDLPKGAILGELRDIEGIWVVSAAIPKTATPPPFEPAEEGPPAGGPEGGPPEGDEGPPAPEGDEAPEGEEGPPGEGDEKGEKGKGGGMEHQMAQLTHMVTKLLGALGIPADDAAGGMPGPEGEVGPTPPGPEGSPPGPDAAGGDSKTHTVHERALKPGEAPPGTTPVGSPAFASTHPDHPWKDVVGKKRTFILEDPIGDRTMASVREELKELAKDTGYSVKRAKEGIDESGQRVARVIVQADSAPVA